MIGSVWSRRIGGRSRKSSCLSATGVAEYPGRVCADRDEAMCPNDMIPVLPTKTCRPTTSTALIPKTMMSA